MSAASLQSRAEHAFPCTAPVQCAVPATVASVHRLCFSHCCKRLCATALQVNTNMLRSLRISRGITDESKLSAGTISVEQSSSSICNYISSKLDMQTTGQYWAADTDTVLPW